MPLHQKPQSSTISFGDKVPPQCSITLQQNKYLEFNIKRNNFYHKGKSKICSMYSSQEDRDIYIIILGRETTYKQEKWFDAQFPGYLEFRNSPMWAKLWQDFHQPGLRIPMIQQLHLCFSTRAQLSPSCPLSATLS